MHTGGTSSAAGKYHGHKKGVNHIDFFSKRFLVLNCVHFTEQGYQTTLSQLIVLEMWLLSLDGV